MELNTTTECTEVIWQSIADSVERVRMVDHEPEVHQRAVKARHTAVFMYDNARLLGFGRATSDGVYQGAIYNVAVLPEARGKGIGRDIIQTILDRLPTRNLILYATPRMEGFYKRNWAFE